ncbi:MAG: methyl-accepting chemotaxis protein [Negativicutes bacterium]|nr:methyl-accepting chemotaxis protein [Negativicutes bacterium]
MNLKLRAKLLLAFFLLISLPCGILGYLSYRQARNALQDSIEEQLQDVVKSAAGQVEASTLMVQKMLEVASGREEFAAAAVTGVSDAALVSLKVLQQSNADMIEDVFLANSAGNAVVFASSGPLVSVKDRSYFSEAIGGKASVSGVVISRTTNKPVVVVAQPLKQNGQIVGVIAAVIDFGSLAKKVGAIKVGQTGYGYLIDKTGLIVFHPNKDMILKENLLQNKDEQVRRVAQKMVEGKAGKDFYTFEGVEKLAAYVPVGQFIAVMTAPVDEYMAPAKPILRNTVIILIAALIIALSLAFLVANSIVRPIQRLRQLMEAAGLGNLTVVSALSSRDEIGDLSRSFDTMISSQNTIVKEVRVASTQLAAASEEMAASCQEVTSTSEEIAGSMDILAREADKGNECMLDTSKALVQLSSLIQIAGVKAASTAGTSKTTYETADEGRTKVTEAVTKMQNIKVQTEKTGTIIAELDDYSKEIGQIVNTITTIAAQTNLLALNAAIEAARAGEHGRGFAVVAEEVRRLAEQSNQGAQEITALIHKVMDKTEEAVSSMTHNAAEVGAGVGIINEAGVALDRILTAVQTTAREIDDINEVTAEEVASSEKIISLIDQLSTMIETVAAHCQQVASGAEQQSAAMQTVAASAEETSGSANLMKNLVEKFEV